MSVVNQKFKRDFAKFIEKSGLNAEIVVRKTAMDMLLAIVKKTPKDTARLFSNINLSIKNPDDKTDYTVSSSIPRAERNVKNYSAGQTIWISTALPYAPVVEYGRYPNPPKSKTGKTVNGYSKQAPQGMFRITVAEFQNYISSNVRKLPK